MSAPPTLGLHPATVPSGRIPATGTTSLALARMRATGASHRAILLAVLPAVGLLVGMALDLPTLILLSGVVALGLAVVQPAVGVALLALMVPLREPEIFGPTWFNVTLVAATMAGCVFRLPIDRPRLTASAGYALLVGYMLFSLVTLPPQVSGFAAEPTETAVYQFLQLAGGVLIFTTGYLVFRQVDAIPYLVVGTVSAAIAAVLGIVFLAGGSDDIAFRGLFSSAPWFSRAVGPFADTNYYGEFLAFAMLVAIGLLGVVRHLMRMVLWAILPVMAVAFVLTFSRGAIVTLAVGLVVLAFVRSVRLGIGVLVVGALVAGVVLPLFLEARLDASLGPNVVDLSAGLTRSDETRLDAFLAGLRLFAAQPVFGIGFGQFQTASGEFIIDAATTYPHNSAIRVLAEQGIVGGLLAGAILVALARSIWRSLHPLRLTAIAVLSAYVAGSFVLEPFWSIQTSGAVWLLFAAVLAPWPTSGGDPADDAAGGI
jgi:O-antigen ligase